MGSGDRQERHQREARSLFASLARDHPEDERFSGNLALCCSNLGNLLHALGRWHESQECHDEALRIRIQLAERHPRDLGQQMALAQSHHNLGAVLGDTGRTREAILHELKAVDLMGPVAQADAKSTWNQIALAGAYHNLGVLYTGIREWDRGEESLQKALRIRERLALDHPHLPDFKRSVAESYFGLGNLYLNCHPSLAVSSYDKAIGILRPLVKDFPTSPDFRDLLAQSLISLGLTASSDLNKAEVALQEAQDLLQGLVRNNPHSVHYQTHLAAAYADRGKVLKDAGRAEASLEWYARAINIFESLRRQQPENHGIRLNLLQPYGGRAQANTALKRYPEAIRDWDQVVDLADNQDRDRYRVAQLDVVRQAGDYARAAAEGNQLADRPTATWETIFNAACLSSLASHAVHRDSKWPPAERAARADAYALQAMKLLAKCRATARKDHAKEFQESIRTDKDLDPLRSRQDFQKLLREP
jgi:tetratricopeptide (TPR) repeat protein